jgi:hypothetical protein
MVKAMGSIRNQRTSAGIKDNQKPRLALPSYDNSRIANRNPHERMWASCARLIIALLR